MCPSTTLVSTQAPSYDNWAKANSWREVYVCTDDSVRTAFPLLLLAEVSPVIREAVPVDIEPNVTVRLVGFLSDTVMSLKQLLTNGHVAIKTVESHIDVLLLCGLLRINLDIQTEWRSQDAYHPNASQNRCLIQKNVASHSTDIKREKDSDLIALNDTCSHGFHEQLMVASNSCTDSIVTAPDNLGEHQSGFETIGPISHGATGRMTRQKAKATLSGSKEWMGVAKGRNSDESETSVNGNDNDSDYIVSECEKSDSESESAYKKQLNNTDSVSSVRCMNGRRTRQKSAQLFWSKDLERPADESISRKKAENIMQTKLHPGTKQGKEKSPVSVEGNKTNFENSCEQVNILESVSSTDCTNDRWMRHKQKATGSRELMAAADGSNSDQSETTVNDDDDSDYIASESEGSDSESENACKKQLNIMDYISSVGQMKGTKTRQKSKVPLSWRKNLDRPTGDSISRKKSVCNFPMLAQLNNTDDIPDTGEHENSPKPHETILLGRTSCGCPLLKPLQCKAIYMLICHCCHMKMKSFSSYAHHRLQKMIGIENIRLMEQSLLKEATSHFEKNSNDSYSCTVCSFNSGIIDALPHIVKHVTAEECGNLKMYYCTICDRRFHWECDLAVHVLEHEPNHWVISCKRCDIRFPSPTAFMHHWQNTCNNQGEISTSLANQLDHRKDDNSICALLSSPVDQSNVRPNKNPSSMRHSPIAYETKMSAVQEKNWFEDRQQKLTSVKAGFPVASHSSDGVPNDIAMDDCSTIVTPISVDTVDDREHQNSSTTLTASSNKECQELNKTKVCVLKAKTLAQENDHVDNTYKKMRTESGINGTIYEYNQCEELYRSQPFNNDSDHIIEMEVENESYETTAADNSANIPSHEHMSFGPFEKAPLSQNRYLAGATNGTNSDYYENPDEDSDYELSEFAETEESDGESESTSKEGTCISPFPVQQNSIENIPDLGEHESGRSRIQNTHGTIAEINGPASVLFRMRSQQGQKRSEIPAGCRCSSFRKIKGRGIYSSCHCCKKVMNRFSEYAHHRLHETVGNGNIRLMNYSLMKEAETHYIQASGSYRCKLCSFVCRTMPHILSHLSGEGCANLKMYHCNSCDKKFSSECQLASHILEHEPAEHWIITCTKCDNRFPSLNQFYHHWKSQCGGLGQAVTCRHCNVTFSSELFYDLHFLNIALEKKGWQTLLDDNKKHESEIVDMHAIKGSNPLTGTIMYKCKYCDHSNQSHGEIARHIVSQLHMDLKIYKCPGCTKILRNKKVLANHYMVHVSQEYWLYHCQKCNLQYSTRASHQAHMRNVHSKKKFLCHICSKCHATKQKLEIHMRTHTGERPYKCDRCPKTFALHYSYKKHIRAHEGIKKYTCDTCSKKFNEKLDLKKHVNSVHLKLKTFECDVCSAKYSTKQGLESHYRRVHGKSK